MSKDLDQIIKQLADHESRIAKLEGKGGSRPKSESTQTKQSKSTSVDFDVNARAFFKQHASNMSGPKKVTLVLAYLAQGDIEQEKTLEEISDQWKKVEGLLGGKIQKMYATRAKEQDWIDSSKQGVYLLRPKWTEIFN